MPKGAEWSQDEKPRFPSKDLISNRSHEAEEAQAQGSWLGDPARGT